MITREVLITEYGKLIREIRDLEQEKSQLVTGSIQKKIINGKTYYYLATRENGKVVTHYIKAEKLSSTEDEIFRRRHIDMTMAELRSSQALIEAALGRITASTEHIKQSVAEVVESHPEYQIEKLTLFGSRAAGTFKDTSDVDLLVKFKKGAKVSLLRLSEIRLALMEKLGLDVDLIHDPIPKDSILEINKTEVVYAT